MTASLRRVALTLHGLSGADRQWVLDKLEPAQRQAVAPLLDELQSLGIPADPEIVQAALRDAPAPASDDPDTRVRMLWQCETGRMAAILRPEPDGLVARVLALRAWPWTAEVLEGLGTARASGIERLRDTVQPVPPRYADMLLRLLHERLLADGRTAPAPSRKPSLSMSGLTRKWRLP